MQQNRGMDVSDKKVQTLKAMFKQYMNSEYAHMKSKSTIFSDAFFPLRHDIGMALWDVLENEESIQRGRLRIEEYFRNVSNRNNPANDANVYMNAIKRLKEFMDHAFGGVGQFIKLSEDKLCGEPILPSLAQTPVKKRTASPPTATHVPRPSCNEVKKYLLLWDSLENYSLQENALNKLFFQTYPQNKDIDDVLIKVSALNDFYSTNIFSPFQVAKHILGLKIDDRLQAGDVMLVNDLAKVAMGNGTTKHFYSFATKYCSHHKPLEFPIYDSYVDKLLRHFKRSDGFASFDNTDLKRYDTFKNVLIQFRNFYNLDKDSLKELDKYLWLLGKEKFPQKYKKKLILLII